MSTVLRRLRDDDGISLVEIMVSIVILGIALTAFAATITRALASITQDEQFVRGNQVAADLVEESRSLAWECIGLDAAATGYRTLGAGGEPMVAMDASGCTPQRVNAPFHQVTVDAQVYEVNQEVVWVDDAGVPGTENSKRIMVELEWEVRGREYSATQESIRVPTPDEVPVASLAPSAPPPAPPPTGCAGQILSMTITPSTVAITPSGLTDEAIVVTVETCADTAGVTLAGATSADGLSSRSMVATPAGSSTRWQVSFPVGTPNFTPGTKAWQATASGSGAPVGTNQASRQITFFQQAALPPVVIQSVTPTPTTSWCVWDNGNDRNALRETVTIAITVSGIPDGSSGTVTVRWTNVAGTVNASYDAASGTWRATIPSTARFSGTATTVYVNARRTSDNAQAAESATAVTINRVRQNQTCPAR